MDHNEAFRDAEFKDARPINTVETIKGILKQYGLETTEHWHETCVPYCYAITVCVEGTTFSVNGKGLTPEFALASGYGELMERLQLGYVGGGDTQRDGRYSANDGQDEIVSAIGLLEKNRQWYQRMAQRLQDTCGVEENPENLLMQFADEEGNVKATPYFNLTTGTKEYLPTALRKRVYSANGCAAGNTMEEALVQAFSEIVERHHHMRVIDEEITLPDIPDEVLRRYQTSYDIISFIRSQGFRVMVKDCSLGTKFPVVALCFVDEKTGRYHTHFGAYPVFEIALQRALTESFQGRSIHNIAAFEDFSYQHAEVRSMANIVSEMTKGAWEKMTSFFVGDVRYPYHEDVGFTGRNNKELLQECVAFFQEQGYDVLVRDASCMNFPTYQILVPGYSEVYTYRLVGKLDDHRYHAYAIKTLRDPGKAALEDRMGLLMHIGQMKKFNSDTTGVHGFPAAAKLSLKLSPLESSQLMAASLAYVYFDMKKYAEAAQCIHSVIPGKGERDTEYLICLKRYLSMCVHRYEAEQIRKILDFFHRPETVEKLYACLAAKKNPMADYVLRCDMSCTEDCMLYGVCCQKRVEELTGIISEKTAQLDFDAFCQALCQKL